MSTFIHSSAAVDKNAAVGEGSYIGPFCRVGGDVVLGENVRLDSHVVVDGHTTIGNDTVVFPFASIGLAPQDLKYRGEETRTEIGERNQIREGVTIHRGTTGGHGLTKVGDDNLFMAQAHIAHDCTIGDGIVLANSTALGGHVSVADGVNIGAFSGVHQFCRVGREAFVGAMSAVVKDPMPYSLSHGNHARCYGINRIGLRRRGHSAETIDRIHSAFRLLLESKLNTTQAIERIRDEIDVCPEVDLLIEFIESSERGVMK